MNDNSDNKVYIHDSEVESEQSEESTGNSLTISTLIPMEYKYQTQMKE